MVTKRFSYFQGRHFGAFCSLCQTGIKQKVKKEIHLQFSGCCWNAFPIMCYVAFTTVVFVGNLATTCYRTFTATPMIAICQVNERKNKAFGGGIFEESGTLRYMH